MTERNPSMARTNGSGAFEYSAHLPVVIQIKVKQDSNKRRSALCCQMKRERFMRNDKPTRCSRKLDTSSLASDCASGSSINRSEGRAAMRHRNHHENHLVPSDNSHSEKWRIFDRTPFRKRRSFAWDKRDSSTGAFTSSDDSVCQCDKVSSFKVVESLADRRRNAATTRIHRYVKREEITNASNDKMPSNSHSDKTFSIHSASSANRPANETVINSVNKPVVKTEIRARKIHQVTEENIQQYVSKIDSRINAETTAKKNAIPLSDNIKRNKDGFCELNYRLILNVLNGSNLTDKIDVLEALRWRITKSKEPQREKTLRDIISQDVLGLRSTMGNQSRLETLLWPVGESDADLLQKSAARLLYTIVSIKMGREYFRNVSIVRSLAWSNNICRQAFHFSHRPLVDIETAEYLVSVMMKLISMEFHRDDMIKNGLFSWLVSHMADVEYSGSPYHFKCIAKLLIELVAGQQINEHVLRYCPQLLILLVRSLENKNLDSCRLFLLRTILLLLKQPDIAQKAIELNFERVLWKRFQDTNNTTERKLLEYILLMLSQKNLNKKKDNQTSLLSEQQILDADLDLDNFTHISASKGEEVLEAKYSVKIQSPYPSKNFNDIANILPLDKRIAQEYAETTMEMHNIPSGSQIFVKENRTEAKTKSKSNDKYRYFNRKFLTLPVVAKDLGNKIFQKDKIVKTVAKTAPEFLNLPERVIAVNSPLETASQSVELLIPERSDEDLSEEARDTIEYTKAIVHVFHDESEIVLLRNGANENKQTFKNVEILERISSAGSEISIGLIESFETRSSRNDNQRSLSVDSDVIIGIFEGVDSEATTIQDKPSTSNQVDAELTRQENRNCVSSKKVVENKSRKYKVLDGIETKKYSKKSAPISENEDCHNKKIEVSNKPKTKISAASKMSTKEYPMSEPENKSEIEYLIPSKKCLSVPSIVFSDETGSLKIAENELQEKSVNAQDAAVFKTPQAEKPTPPITSAIIDASHKDDIPPQSEKGKQHVQVGEDNNRTEIDCNQNNKDAEANAIV